jgi:hypothetical protein
MSQEREVSLVFSLAGYLLNVVAITLTIRASTVMVILLTIAGVVTPLGLSDSISLSGTTATTFEYANDNWTSAFIRMTELRLIIITSKRQRTRLLFSEPPLETSNGATSPHRGLDGASTSRSQLVDSREVLPSAENSDNEEEAPQAPPLERWRED